jgi:cytoskeleton protein RodZ
MTNTDKMSSYGLYLQTIRVEKGITIERVAEESRIRAEILRAIEAEDHDNLPDDVFVKGFLRLFAEAIGADPEEALRRFAIRRKPQPVVNVRSSDQPEKQGRLWLTLLWIAVLMIGLIGGTLLVYQMVYQKERDAAAPTSEVSEKEHVVSADHTPSSETSTDVPDAAIEATTRETSDAGEPTKYVLEIVCHENTWLKVIADDARATEHNLKPGETIALKANTMFNLLIGNAGGVTVQLNGKPVPISGASGQVVNLQLP